MKITNTGDVSTTDIPVYMLIYGAGGIGKTTFAASAPGAFMADCENGSKFLGARGIKIPVAQIETWYDFAGDGQFVDMAIKSDKTHTIIVDPIGELMEKCKQGLTGSALVTPDGSPTIRGWGEMSIRMKAQFRKLRDSGKHVILIAHVEEKEDEGRMVKRPKIQTKISEDIVNMVDIVGYMLAITDAEGNTKRAIFVDGTNDKIVAKDRTSKLTKYVKPDFNEIYQAIQGITKEVTLTVEEPVLEDKREAKLTAVKDKLATVK